MKKLVFTRACLSDVRVIMVIMRISLVKWLYQVAIGQIHALEYLSPGARGACGHALSCQAINTAASLDPDA
jgi:hypothetical protein